MTIDKFIAVKWPHKAAVYNSSKRAKVIAIGIFVSVVIYNIPHIFLTRVIGNVCFASATEGIITKVYSWVSFVFNAVIPFTVLIYMNTVIVKAVKNSHTIFETKEINVNKRDSHHSQIVRKGNEIRERRMKNAGNQLTIMLLLVTTLFFILLIPTYIRFIFITFFEPDTPDIYGIAMLVYQISHKSYHTNFGINFYLYCISGQKFRNDLKEILSCFGGIVFSSSSNVDESNISQETTIH